MKNINSLLLKRWRLKYEFRRKNPFIFIISGKARHGKDTVASMIRNAYEKLV